MLAVCINHRNLTNKPEVTAQPQDSTEATNWTKTRRNRGSGEAETPCSLPGQLTISKVSGQTIQANGDHYGTPGGRTTIPASCSPSLDFLFLQVLSSLPLTWAVALCVALLCLGFRVPWPPSSCGSKIQPGHFWVQIVRFGHFLLEIIIIIVIIIIIILYLQGLGKDGLF